jgi:pilus assembly protein TadC
MSINIACSTIGCLNPVIGQCTGYKKTCGKYYCHEHSSDTLCANCAKQKTEDEHAELVYQEYLVLAEKVSQEPDPEFKFQDKKRVKRVIRLLSTGTILLVVLIIAGIVVGNIAQEISQGLKTFYSALIIVALILIGLPILDFLEFYSSRKNWIEKEKQIRISKKVRDIDAEKQGFAEFWDTWVKQRKEEEAEKKKQALIRVLTVAGAIAAIGLAAAASTSSESEYDRTRRAVRDELNRN